jgi:hypothetical protein
MGASGLFRLRYYGHLEKTESRLRQLLRDFGFGTVSEVLGAVEALSAARWKMSRA